MRRFWIRSSIHIVPTDSDDVGGGGRHSGETWRQITASRRWPCVQATTTQTRCAGWLQTDTNEWDWEETYSSHQCRTHIRCSSSSRSHGSLGRSCPPKNVLAPPKSNNHHFNSYDMHSNVTSRPQFVLCACTKKKNPLLPQLNWLWTIQFCLGMEWELGVGIALANSETSLQVRHNCYCWRACLALTVEQFATV